jgi:hypothetical protein
VNFRSTTLFPGVARICADIDEVGRRAHQYTELAHRTDSNFYDVRAALDDMSCNIKQLLNFVQFVDEITFPHGTAPFSSPADYFVLDSFQIVFCRRSFQPFRVFR